MVSAYQSLLSVPPDVTDQASWAPTPTWTATVPGMVTPVTSYPAPCRPISIKVCGAPAVPQVKPHLQVVVGVPGGGVVRPDRHGQRPVLPPAQAHGHRQPRGV